MKLTIYINMILLFVLAACTTVTLTDGTQNKFDAVATKGTYQDKVQVTWLKTPFYTHYEVYRSSSQDGFFENISGKITGAFFDDKNVTPGISYFYKVRGLNNVGLALHTTDSTDGFVDGGSGLRAPTDISINTGQSIDFIELSWKRVSNAEEYEILRSEDNTFFHPIARTSLLHYKDMSVELGKKYYYQITSYDDEGFPSPDRSKILLGELFGTDLEVTTQPGQFSDKIKITWNSYPYATEYKVYRSVNDSDSLGDLQKTIKPDQIMEFIDTNVKEGELYYYTVSYQNNFMSAYSTAVRSYVLNNNAPLSPQNVIASQATHPSSITITWDTVDSATSYDVLRSYSSSGPWEVIGSTSSTRFEDSNLNNDSYSYFYAVISKNQSFSSLSDSAQGWANRAPLNITASQAFSSKVRLTWDAVPNAAAYNIIYSESSTGPFVSAGVIRASGNVKEVFDHIVSIGNELNQKLFYRISVTLPTGSVSTPSQVVRGEIQKIGSPNNLQIRGNKTATRSMSLTWDPLPGAQRYQIYRAVLKHGQTDPNTIKLAHFTKVGESQNAAYNITFNTYPIRRYVYMVAGIDVEGAAGVGVATDVLWRLPVDAADFAKDVDFTIVQAQRQIRNFGYNGSSGTVTGRAGGTYQYSAGISGSKSAWNNYMSFEAILDGAPSVSIDIANFSAKLNGPMTVKGLYSGRIIYNDLNAYDGGFVFSGGMTIEYNHPTQGLMKETWDFNKAGIELISVVLSGKEQAPSYPSYEQGSGN